MKKLQAAMKDNAAKRMRESAVMYKIGSCFKGCHNCGEYGQDEDGGSRKRYTSGYQVFRSYYPCRTRWTYWCYECGAKDAAAWEGAADIGRDAIRGSKEAIKHAKNLLRRSEPAGPSKCEELADLQKQIAALELMLVGRKQ